MKRFEAKIVFECENDIVAAILNPIQRLEGLAVTEAPMKASGPSVKAAFYCSITPNTFVDDNYQVGQLAVLEQTEEVPDEEGG